MVTKIFKLDGTEFGKDDIVTYIDNTIDRVYAILVTYEQCAAMENPDFSTFKTYVERMIVEFAGIYHWLSIDQFISAEGILNGMIKKMDTLTHTQVKSLTFHCISVLNKVKVS